MNRLEPIIRNYREFYLSATVPAFHSGKSVLKVISNNNYIFDNHYLDNLQKQVFFKKKTYQEKRIDEFKKLSTNSNISGNPKLTIPALFEGKGQISFGKNVELGYYPSPYYYTAVTYLEARQPEAKINFGNNVMANNGLMIICEKSEITIDDDVLIGYNVQIIDSDFHSVDPGLRRTSDHSAESVFIGKNVFIGSNACIQKGVKIGMNSIVAQSAVVTASFPENVIVGGNPARIIGKVNSDIQKKRESEA